MADAPFTEKIEREREFHNQWAKTLDLDELLVREAFESPTAIENRHALLEMGRLQGKKILDLGCGAGESSVYFALCGADVHACDIAEDFLKVGEALARKYGVSVQFRQAEVGRLPYEDGTFDLVYGNGVLHHVDLLPAAKEIARVLKKDGKAVFIEPLPYNPIINVYRHLAKGVRTEDEKPLRFSQLRQVSTFFSEFRHEEFWLFSLSIFLHFYFVRRWNPSKVRYWKKIIEEGEAYRGSFATLQKWDGAALKMLPFLRRLCWNSVLVGVK